LLWPALAADQVSSRTFSASILEGLDEMLTVTKLGLPPELRRSLACTNIIENVMGTGFFSVSASAMPGSGVGAISKIDHVPNATGLPIEHVQFYPYPYPYGYPYGYYEYGPGYYGRGYYGRGYYGRGHYGRGVGGRGHGGGGNGGGHAA
jgi:hypothetical protein